MTGAIQVNAFRIVKTKWASTALDGEGARLFGGRWNSKARRCVYLSSTLSLATLEVLVHLNGNQLLQEYSVLRLMIPQDVIYEAAEIDLPANWREDPAPAETAAFGDDWLTSRQSAGLWVPSCIIPDERNLLLNPDHPAFNDIIAGAEVSQYQFDKRLKDDLST